MATVVLDSGLEIFHRVHGRGEPLLLIAGSCADHTFWGAQVVAYRERYRTIVYDSRGTGRSSKPLAIESYTMEAMAGDAIGLLDALGIETAHVSGLSLGSAVAQEMAIRYPDRVRTLQLHGTWGRGDAAFLRHFDLPEKAARRGDWLRLGRFATKTSLSPTFFEENPAEGERLARNYVIDHRHPPSLEGILGHIHADRIHDSLDRLHAVRCPTLVTCGENDRQLVPPMGRAVAERIPGAEFHLFRGPRAYHLVNLEMSEEFNRVTLDWLGRHGGCP